ncbi:MAG: carotenoid oxygenase family protein [Pleurocapsa sp.]
MLTESPLAPWSKSLARPATEFALTPLSVISGSIPPDLNGTLYRNGPARLERGSERVGHWFDGDGAILGVHLRGGEASAVYRYVETAGYKAEAAADSFIYPNYGMTASGAFWNNWFKPVKNAANTSVLALSDRLLALWEGGHPYALDLEDLTTLGQDDLSGLTDKQPFSAHPKIDRDTGEIFNFGVSAGLNAKLNLYCCTPTGQVKRKNSFSLSGLPLIHDFVLAGGYLVFLISPVRVNLAAVMFAQKSYSDALQWKPELGTEILIFDRHNLNLVSRSTTEPWYQWHFANGYVDAEHNIITEFVRYPDFQTNQYLKEVATGNTQTYAKGTLWQLKINPQTGDAIASSQLNQTQCEFPVVSAANISQAWRYTYLSVPRQGDSRNLDLFTALASFDRQTHNLTITDIGEHRYPSEPIFVPQKDNLPHGWLLTVVYDGNKDCSEVWIYQSDRLFDKPVCRLALPSVIPPSFHGTWKSC